MNSSYPGTQRKGSILSVIDFSEASIDSLKWAAELAQEKKTHLTVLYPYRLRQSIGGDVVAENKRTMDSEAEKSFNQLARPVLSESLITYDFHPEIGFIYDRVYSHANRNEIMFIIMSQKMASANKDILNDLINVISAPLVIVPQVKRLTEN
jgi:hypothetical protein